MIAEIELVEPVAPEPEGLELGVSAAIAIEIEAQAEQRTVVPEAFAIEVLVAFEPAVFGLVVPEVQTDLAALEEPEEIERLEEQQTDSHLRDVDGGDCK